ncbi:MAG: hypothetical protein FWH23_00540 [Bacteroidales bacterium]|nr:hypothetical protein [Bacteroidales bacterium]
MYSELTQGSCFILDETRGLFSLQTGYIIVGNNLKYLLAVLNSRLIEFSFRKFYSIELGGSGLRWLKQYVENIPIPKPSIEIELQIEKLLLEKNYQAINKLVYEIYKLDKNEIDFIDFQ